MKIAIASDHAGFQYKQEIKKFLAAKGHEVEDFGTHSEEMVDYPIFMRPAAEAVARGDLEAAVLLGGSGNGEAIVANKVRGIRCAVCWDKYTAQMAREHNDANVISIGQRTVPIDSAIEIVETWLGATFQEGRHLRRIRQIEPNGEGSS